MPYSILISDLHLDAQRPHHLQALRQLLEAEAGQCRALYVLGDLFEAWIGDDDDDPFYREAIAAFRKFADSASRLYFMHGNRDFLLGETFEHDTGGTLLEEGSVHDLHGRSVLLMHGDSLCTDDEAHQDFRRQVRDPDWQRQMLAKPLEERRMMAQMLRMKSMQNNENKPENIMDVNAAEVVRVMEEAGVRELIHGHTHRPAVHSVPLPSGGTGRRWVLGDWGEQGWWIRADEEHLRLESFPLDQAGTPE